MSRGSEESMAFRKALHSLGWDFVAWPSVGLGVYNVLGPSQRVELTKQHENITPTPDGTVKGHDIA